VPASPSISKIATNPPRLTSASHPITSLTIQNFPQSPVQTSEDFSSYLPLPFPYPVYFRAVTKSKFSAQLRPAPPFAPRFSPFTLPSRSGDRFGAAETASSEDRVKHWTRAIDHTSNSRQRNERGRSRNAHRRLARKSALHRTTVRELAREQGCCGQECKSADPFPFPSHPFRNPSYPQTVP